ncbi:MAG: hypothetical protein QG636_649 [Patescibacteria group bacterium]|jgi:predicted nuclease of restriction endonuclease-like RecB superfamily|nr:hypothetical protein [Patescibacteria group bacterium]
MRHAFYDSEEYRTKQSEITSRNQKNRVYEHLKKEDARVCVREGCDKSFVTQPTSPKRYCGNRCAATVNNSKRRWSNEVKQKISQANKGRKSPLKGSVLVPRTIFVCCNPNCRKEFYAERYKKRKFCTVLCSIQFNGSQPTSAKASRGKSGVRLDVDPMLSFHSRWEANVARLYTLQGKVWLYEPETFDIGNQTYTPDFYLPADNLYIEVKNFWSEYSRLRDEKFRKHFPHHTLKVILKKEYLELEKQYASKIPEWEFKNSPCNFPTST